MAAPAAGDLNITGDWVINSGLVIYNENITVTGSNGTNSTDGNVTITSSGFVTLYNVTLRLASGNAFTVHGLLDASYSTFDGLPWFFDMEGTVRLSHVRVQNATLPVNGTVGGTWVNTTGAWFDNVTWNATTGDSYIHVRVPMNFTHNFLGDRVTLRIEVTPAYGGTAVRVAHNAFDVGYSDLYGVIVMGNPIPLPSSFDIHDNTFHDAYVAITIARADPQASYTVRNNFVNNTGWGSLLEIGDTFGSQRFDGALTATNNTIYNSVRGVRMYGNIALTSVVHIDRLYSYNASTGVIADDGTIVLTNSTILAAGTTFDAQSEGHIKVYSSNVLAMDADNPGNNGSVEGFAFLNLLGFTWQGGVPFVGDGLTLRNATGAVDLVLDPATWTPREAVLWARYSGNVRVDNSDLRPVVVDGTDTFACTPAQFYFGDTMLPVSVSCQDDRAPAVSVSAPLPGAYINRSSFAVSGNMSESGSGIATFEWSLDNVSFHPIAPGANNSTAFSFAVGPLPDGAYTVTVRGVDRTGNARYLVVFPLRLDTVFPEVAVGSFPAWTQSTSWDMTGSSEPFARLTVRRAYGWNQTVTLGANGTFLVTVPLDEGQNTFAVRVVDPAGNAVEVEAIIRVDTLAPPVAGLLDGQPTAALWTANGTVLVSGSCEAGASVVVGAAVVARAGSAFEAELPLATGRNEIDVVCTDPAGNRGHWYAFAFRDDEPPVLSVVVEGAVELGPGRYLVTSSLVPIGGTITDAGSGVDRASVGGEPVALSGAGSLTVSVAAPAGESSFEVMAVDHAGNTARVVLTVLRDSDAPQAAFAWVEAGSPILEIGGVPTTRGAQVALQITLSEPAHVAYGTDVHVLPSGVTLEAVSLAPGLNVLWINVTDAAGNFVPTVAMQIVLDLEPPSLSLYSPQEGAVVTERSLSVTGKAEAGSTVTVAGNGVALSSSGDFHAPVELAPGQNTVVVVATDALGNTVNTSVTVTYTPPEPAPETAPAGSLEVPLLVVGLVAGMAVGALAFRGRAGPGRAGRGPATGPGPSLEEAAPPDLDAVPSAARPARGPKGPRGPAPPP
jgi:hypothetical protein